MRPIRMLALLLIACACASRSSPPTHFGRWGPISQVQEPDRSVLVAAITAVTRENPKSFVLARYAGDVYRRLDLASLDRQVPVAVDVDDRLGPIDTGPPAHRAKVFEYDFHGRATILEMSAPVVHGTRATVTASRWDGLAWSCSLRGRSERLTLNLENNHWIVTAAVKEPGELLLKSGCP